MGICDAMIKITVLATGGTFDKNYCDDLSDYRIGKPQVTEILQQANVGFETVVEAIIGKDSLDMTAEDRRLLYQRVAEDTNSRVVITHGTDTMVETAQALAPIKDKTIVITGAMQPARFRNTDAHFNAGFAFAAVRLLPAGVYIAMNGLILNPEEAVKNRAQARFERRKP